MEFEDRVKLALVRFGLRFERLYPLYIKYGLQHRLKQLRENGIVSDYRVSAKRKERLHYLVQVDLDVNKDVIRQITTGGELNG